MRFFSATLFVACLALSSGASADRARRQNPAKLSDRRLRTTALLVNPDRLWSDHVLPLMHTRVPGTPGNLKARQFIVSQLEQLDGWDVELDPFVADTPMGAIDMANVIATFRSAKTAHPAERYLVLCAHYDSKYFPDPNTFIGATDSAVPVAILLHLAQSLSRLLSLATSLRYVTLRLVFFDGEEAFKEWTPTDSIYGARHLASKWENDTKHATDAKDGVASNELDSIDVLCLLDLMGHRNARFASPFSDTEWLHNSIVKLERRLSANHLLETQKEVQTETNKMKKKKQKKEYSAERNTFQFHSVKSTDYRPRIEDDHIPFLARNVPVLHEISVPFPKVWHTNEDNLNAIDRATVVDLCRVFTLFVVEYLKL